VDALRATHAAGQMEQQLQAESAEWARVEGRRTSTAQVLIVNLLTHTHQAMMSEMHAIAQRQLLPPPRAASEWGLPCVPCQHTWFLRYGPGACACALLRASQTAYEQQLRADAETRQSR
jgi:hypothetical protein